MGESSIIDYGTWFVAFTLCVVVLISITKIGGDFATAYNVPNYSVNTLIDSDYAKSRINNMTSDLNGAIQNTQVMTQTSNANTLGAGVTAWKIFLNMPSLIMQSAGNIFNVLNLDIGGFPIWQILCIIIVVLFFWTLGYFFINGGSTS